MQGDGGLKEVAREVRVELDEEAVAAQLGERLQHLRPQHRQLAHGHLSRRGLPACSRRGQINSSISLHSNNINFVL